MTHHLVIAHESVDQTMAAINWVDETVLTVENGTDLEVPRIDDQDLRQLFAFYGLSSNLERLRWFYQTIDRKHLPDYMPVDQAAAVPDRPNVFDLRQRPLTLGKDDILQAQAENDGAGAVEDVVVMAHLGGQVPSPVSVGDAIPTRWTGTHTTSAAFAFEEHDLSYVEDIDPGRYRLIGRLYKGDSALAHRVVRTNSQLKPGMPAVQNETTMLPAIYQPGQLGVLAEFNDNSPPPAEVFASSAAAQNPEGIDWIVRIGDRV